MLVIEATNQYECEEEALKLGDWGWARSYFAPLGSRGSHRLSSHLPV